MNQSFRNYFLSAGLILSAPVALLAQDARSANQERKEADQIIITQNGSTKEKMVIEINGDKVTVNGKDVKEMKGGDVSVKRRKVRDVYALNGTGRAVAPGQFNLSWDDENTALSLFAADSNRAMLGVTTEEDDKGARITSVNDESAAQKAGLKSGDVITKIGDAAIEDAEDVTAAVRKHKPGDKVAVTFLRDDKEQKLTAELGKWKGLRVNANSFRTMTPGRIAPFEPHPNFDLNINQDWAMSYGRPRMGLSVQDTEDGKGVNVKAVEGDSNAAKAGVKEGDVITGYNDKAVNSVDELRREIAEGNKNMTNKIKVLRNGKEQTLEVRTPRKLKSADL